MTDLVLIYREFVIVATTLKTELKSDKRQLTKKFESKSKFYEIYTLFLSS